MRYRTKNDQATIGCLAWVIIASLAFLFFTQPTSTPTSMPPKSDQVKARLSPTPTGTLPSSVSNFQNVVTKDADLIETDSAKEEIPLCSMTNRDSNLRAGPGTNYAIIGFAPKDSCLPLIWRDTDGTWYAFEDVKVFGSGVRAWIWANLVDNVSDDLALISLPPMPSSQVVNSSGCPGGCTTYPTSCAPPIKGNVSYTTGEKIYHVFGQEFYEQTKINPAYGEVWFCNEDDAIAAGWRKARN